MIDVVVLTRDNPAELSRLRAALDAETTPWTGFLVNNGTGPVDAPGWLVLTPGHNTAFGEGVNLAARRGKGKWIVLLSDDAVPRPGFLAAITSHDDGVVGALCVSSDGRLNHAGGAIAYGWRPVHVGRGGDPTDQTCHLADWTTFAAVAIRRECFTDVGGMDEDYWYSYDDVDFCLTARQRGWTVSVCADAIVDHDESGTRTDEAMRRNRRRFLERWATCRT